MKVVGTFIYSTSPKWCLTNVTTGKRTHRHVLDDSWNLAHILCDLGMFPSVSQARKNGFDKPIPKGLEEFQINKHLKIFTVKQ